MASFNLKPLPETNTSRMEKWIGSHLEVKPESDLRRSEIISATKHLSSTHDSNIRTRITMLVKKLYGVGGNKQKTDVVYHGVALKEQPVDLQCMIASLKLSFPHTVIDVSEDNDLTAMMIASEHGVKHVTVDVASNTLDVCNVKHENIKSMTAQFTGDITLRKCLVRVITARQCSLKISPSCESYVWKVSSQNTSCSPCLDTNRQRRMSAKRSAKREALTEVQNSLEAVSPEFANHVNNQIQMSTNKNVKYTARTKNACLRANCRNRASYDDMRADTVFGKLPSQSTLYRYKNQIKQHPGINGDHLNWMSEEAKRLKINKKGRCGGLVLDEVTIQADVTLTSADGKPTIYGLNDYGPTINNLRKVYPKKQKKKANTEQKKAENVSNKVLQFVFNGWTGFHFPVAHYPITNMDAAELRQLIMEVISALHLHGFQTRYVMMDGAPINRSIIQEIQSIFGSYSMPNPNCHEKITFIMDPKHTVKKMRNSLVTSGGKKRLIKSRKGNIVWDHWWRVYRWSNGGFIRQARKLQKAHLYPSKQEKMRNELAEQVLDQQFLFSMRHYVSTLSKPEELDATIELLEHTSELISIFLDKISIDSPKDPRMNKLKEAYKYFSQFLNKDPKESFTSQTSYDVLCTIGGLIELFEDMSVENVAVVPGNVNSDIVENYFSIIRGLFNGSSDHPNYFQYKTMTNAAILTQPQLSRKRNANIDRAYVQPPKVSKQC